MTLTNTQQRIRFADECAAANIPGIEIKSHDDPFVLEEEICNG
jgi:hypothetical protein